MSIDTAKVQGRRELHFNSLDDIVADVERLAQGRVRAIGNWTPGQVLRHLTVPMVWCLDGAPIRAAWHMRVVGRVQTPPRQHGPSRLKFSPNDSMELMS